MRISPDWEFSIWCEEDELWKGQARKRGGPNLLSDYKETPEAALEDLKSQIEDEVTP